MKIVRLEDIAVVSAGGSAPQGKKFFENGMYPFFRTSDVGVAHLTTNLLNPRDKLNEEGIRGLRLFKKGTILFPKSGASTYLNHRAIMGEDGYVVSHLAAITTNETIVNPKYLYYFLTTVNAKTLLQDQDYPALKLSVLKTINLPLPAPDQQRQVIERLDAAFEKINTAIENTEKNLINSYVLFGGLLNDTIHQNPKVESKMIGEVADIEYGLTEKAKASGDLRLIRITDINSDGFLNHQNAMYINSSQKAKQYLLKDGDLVVARTGATFGKVLYFEGQPPSVFASYLIRINFKENIHPKLFWYYAKTPQYWGQAKSLSGGAAQPQFNGNALKQIKFSYPVNSSDQEAMIAKLDTYHDSTIKLKKLYQQKLNYLQALKQSILRETFSRSRVE
jgi:hypothetical protein